MDLSLASLWEWTKLFIRDPRTAAGLVKAAKLPIEVSVLMIVLAGVVSTGVSWVYHIAIGAPDMVFTFPDGQVVVFSRSGPIAQGIYAVITGVGLAVAIFAVGSRQDGRGSLADILSVTAVLQLVVTVIVVAQTIAGLVLPLIAFGLMILSLYVFFRGLAHAVNVAHEYDSMGKSAWVILLSFLALVVVVFVLSAVFGLGPQGELQ